MKKTMMILLAALLLTLTACAGSGTEEGLTARFQRVCGAEEALEQAKKTDTVVFEARGCTSGAEVWDAFYRSVTEGKPATVLCAHYYELDRARVSEELYAAEKDQYPKLFFYLVAYDGTEFTVETRESTQQAPEDRQTFPYLLHFTGQAPDGALYDAYDNYVLVDDPTATWEGITAGLTSAQLGAGYRHCTVYSDCLGWKGADGS